MRQGEYADAYCHVGRPRFGTAQQALQVWDRHGIYHGVLVLGPGVPAFEDLAVAVRDHGERIRGIGIPFGSTAGRHLESVRIAVKLGAIGCRIGGGEVLENPDVLTFLGERGLWAYGIGPCDNVSHAGLYLDWLESFPQARLASPHFLRRAPMDLAGEQGAVYRRLLAHERFFPILSRHGGASTQPYPHAELVPWVRQVVEHVGFDRMLWGSEHPCLYWRDETLERCLRWLGDLEPGIGSEHMARFLGGNTTRVFFSDPPPETEPVTVPVWVEEEFERNRTVSLVQGSTTIDLPMPSYAVFLSDFLRRRETGEEGLLLSAYLAEQLELRARELARDDR